MKDGIHPDDYREVVFMDAAADFSFLTRSTVKSNETIQWEDGKEYPVVRLDVSSASHPFYTGKQRFVDTAGRVEKFQQRFAWQDTTGKAVLDKTAEEKEKRREELKKAEDEKREQITSRRKANEDRRKAILDKKRKEAEAKAAAEAEEKAKAEEEAKKAEAAAPEAAAEAPKAEDAPKTDDAPKAEEAPKADAAEGEKPAE